MSEKNAVQKYTGDTVTKEQAEELMMNPTNLGILTTPQRASFLWQYAEALGVDPRTKPFDLIPGQSGKLIIYANRACSDQLRQKHKLTITELYSGPLMVGDETRKDVWMTKVRVTSPEGRSEDHVGCVGVEGLTGEAYANAVMKCATKATRRGTIAFCGLGMLDESEVGFAAAPGARPLSEQLTVDATPVDGEKPIQPKILSAKPLPSAAPPARV